MKLDAASGGRQEDQVGEADDGGPDPETEAVDGENQRLGEVDELVAETGKAMTTRDECWVFDPLGHLEQIGARTERPPSTGEQGHRNVGILCGGGERVSQHASYNASLKALSASGRSRVNVRTR